MKAFATGFILLVLVACTLGDVQPARPLQENAYSIQENTYPIQGNAHPRQENVYIILVEGGVHIRLNTEDIMFSVTAVLLVGPR